MGLGGNSTLGMRENQEAVINALFRRYPRVLMGSYDAVMAGFAT
jgi:hypothetical protein